MTPIVERAAIVLLAGALVATASLHVERTASAESPGLSAARRWALATSAVLTARNRERHDLLGGMERTPATAGPTRELLDRWWGARDREGLLQSLDWIDGGGHRARFAEMADAFSRRTEAELEAIQRDPRLTDDDRRQVAVVLREYRRLGARGLIGWDYARYVSLCRWGYVAGYLSEEEAWTRIMEAARLIQRTFGSWSELGQNYLLGREFWSPAETARNGHLYEAAVKRLLTDPQSPWVRLPWHMDLGPASAGRRQ